MLNRSRFFLALFVAGMIACLAGCGGGGSGSTSGGAGKVTGRLVALPGRASRAPITVGMDGAASSTPVGADGAFALNGVPAGLHTFVARGDRSAVAFVANVTAGTETNVGNISLRDSGQVSGLVTSVDKHAPIPGASVTATEIVLTNTADILPHPVRVSQTNGDGSYTISALPVGDYLINVSKDGFQSASLTISVLAASTSTGDVQLQPDATTAKGIVSGTAYLLADDGTKSPLAGVMVRLAPSGTDPDPGRPMPLMATSSGGASVPLYPGRKAAVGSRAAAPGPGGGPAIYPVDHEFYAFTDESGAYKIDGVPAGSYTGVAVRPGFEPDSKPVTVTDGAVANADFALTLRKPQAGIISGTVTSSATQKPIQNATVVVFFAPPPMMNYLDAGGTGGSGSAGSGVGFAPASPPVFSSPIDLTLMATTDANGHYELKVPAGTQAVSASADGFIGSTSTVQVPNGGTVSANFALDPDINQVTFTGHVYTSSAAAAKQPVSGATISGSEIFDPRMMGANGIAIRPSFFFTATTNDKGEFSVTLHGGQYSVVAHKDNLYAGPLNIDLSHTTSQDFLIEAIAPPPAPGN